MSVLADLSLFPIGKGESVHNDVTRAVRIIRDSGLTYRLGPMGTTIEGDYDQVMGVVRQCFEELRRDCDRIYMTVKLDYRSSGENRLESKVATVTSALNA